MQNDFKTNEQLGEILKPCPFCGSEAWLLYANDIKPQPYVECMDLNVIKRELKCPMNMAYGRHYRTEKEAIEAWNMRAGE